MFILLFSDSHGNVEELKKTIAAYDKVDLVIHLGDYVKDVNRIRGSFPELKFECVAGNNDWTSSEPIEKLIELEGKKFFLTHGHNYNVKMTTSRLVKRGQELNADAVFFGHTHLAAEFFEDNMLVLNPGSLGRPCLPPGPTYCEVCIIDDKIVTRFKTLI